MDAKHVAEKLFASGYLMPELSAGKIKRTAKKTTVGDKRERYVCIKTTILGEEGRPEELEHTDERSTLDRFFPDGEAN